MLPISLVAVSRATSGSSVAWIAAASQALSTIAASQGQTSFKQHLNSWRTSSKTESDQAAKDTYYVNLSPAKGCTVLQRHGQHHQQGLFWTLSQQTQPFGVRSFHSSSVLALYSTSKEQQQQTASALDSLPHKPGSGSAAQDPESIRTLPNMLSVARALSGPPIAALIMAEAWEVALVATVVSGVTDWADGALARRLGQSSVLGSYLDPLADKVLVGCVAGALAAKAIIPAWVASLIIGRDVALVTGMFLHRWRMLGWRVSGLTAEEFFRTRQSAAQNAGAGSLAEEGAAAQGATSGGAAPEEKGANEAGVSGAPPAGAPGGGNLPFMRPLMISKLNTVLQLALVSGCMSKAALGWPEPDLLSNVEVATAATTVASCLAYAGKYASGKLLPAGSTK